MEVLGIALCSRLLACMRHATLYKGIWGVGAGGWGAKAAAQHRARPAEVLVEDGLASGRGWVMAHAQVRRIILRGIYALRSGMSFGCF